MKSQDRQSLEQAIEQAVKSLESDMSMLQPKGQGSRRKWSGPWWTWQVFIRQASDLPRTPEDREKMDCCHCELAIFYMTLSACGCDMEMAAPWIRKWFLEHQLPDGGLNCDPRAYSGSMKSSVISTLRPLEAVLKYTNRDFTAQETAFLDEGVKGGN